MPDPTVTAAPDSLVLALVVPDSVRAGEPVPITLRLENRGARSLDLYLRGRTLTFDVEVTDAGDRVVWRRLEHQILPAILHLRPLAPGERVEDRFVWDQRTVRGPLEAGVYAVRGLLLVEGPPRATPPVPLTILPR